MAKRRALRRMELVPDDKFFHRFASLTDGLMMVLGAPVSLPPEKFGARFYWDCAPEGQEEEAEELMKSRVGSPEGNLELTDHLIYFNRFIPNMRTICWHIGKGTRKEASEMGSELVRDVGKYCEKVVHPHKKRMGEHSFLEFPYAIQGFNLDVLENNRGERVIVYRSFNPKRSLEGARSCLASLNEAILAFGKNPEAINPQRAEEYSKRRLEHEQFHLEATEQLVAEARRLE